MMLFIFIINIGILIVSNGYSESYHFIFRNRPKKQVLKLIIFGLGVSAIMVGSALAGYFHAKSIYDTIEEKQIEYNDSTIVLQARKQIAFEDSVYQYIKFLNIKHPEVVFKQAKIESANFNSKVFKDNNNMFGMKIPNKRANLVNGENMGYAVYNTWQESIIDYALYQTYSAKGMTKEQYIQHLGNSYAEDPNYKSKIK